MVDRENIIMVGLLTRQDLDRLGSGFRAAIPVQEVGEFEALLDAIDESERRSLAVRGE